MGNIDAEDFDEFLLHAEPVDVVDLPPAPERNHKVNALFVANGFDAEHRSNVNDTNATHFHVVAGQFSASPDDVSAVDKRYLGDVIGDQAIAALDECQDALALADAAFATQDDAHTQDV